MRDSLYVEVIGRDNMVYPSKGDAGIDLIAADEGELTYRTDSDFGIRYIEYNTGIRIAPSSDFLHGFVFPRSSISNYDLSLCNSPAVIDSSYRGEIKLRFRVLNKFEDAKIYKKGDKIAQLIFMYPFTPNLIDAKEFSVESERGEGGFGSTGN